MPRTRIELDQIGWHELASGSLGGPASFIGLDVNGQPVLVAASSYVAAGGGSKIDAKTKRGLRGDFDGDDGV